MTGKVLFVDDEPNVLDGIRRSLRKEVDIETAVGGAAALDLLRDSGPFALVVSDMRMPGMSGPELLSRVRESSPDTVRMVLSGQADLASAIEVVNDAQIFRFLTKPCSSEQLLAAVQSGLEQYRLITCERELLEKTVSGAVRMMADVLGMTNPAAYAKAARIQYFMDGLVRELAVRECWQFRVAAMLSQLGCVALPPDTIAKVYAGQALTADEERLYRSHPELAGRLLAEIPRLEDVAAMVAAQEGGPAGPVPAGNLKDWDVRSLGRVLLRAAAEYDRLLTSGVKPAVALAALKGPGLAVPAEVVEALRRVPPSGDQQVTRLLHVKDLTPGMVVDEDVTSMKGVRLMSRGQQLTRPLLERLRSVAAGVGVVEPVRVQAPA